MKFSKIISLILALVLVTAMVAACGDKTPAATPTPTPAATPTPDAGGSDPDPVETPPVDDTVYKFNVSFAAPEFSTSEVVASLNRIQEASNGRIEFTYYFSWSLTSVPTCIDDINAGIVDICVIPTNEHQNLFPYSNLIVYTPFLGLPTMADAAAIFDEMYYEHEALQQEYANNGLVYWTNFPCPGYNIYTTTDHEIRVPTDLNGLKIITSSPLLQKLLTQSGGAPVTAPVTEYATSLNTNVVDGLINHANVVNGFGCMDFVHGATVFGEQGMTIALMTVVFGDDVWNALPADLQQLFTDEAEALRVNQGNWDYNANAANIGTIETRDDGVTYLTADEIQAWEDAFESIRAEYINELISSGSDQAQTLYDAVQAKIAARS